ncbi:MAG: PEP/pyruvate-binding domain-containing protein [Nitrososphaerota archaeon]
MEVNGQHIYLVTSSDSRGDVPLFVDIEEADSHLLPVLGRKCAFLGELKKLGFKVPEGFFISIPVYLAFLKETGIEERIKEAIVNAETKGFNVETYEELASLIMNLIQKTEMPLWIAREIENRYELLCSKFNKEVPVAVRSSGVESRPGLFDTYLYVVGKSAVIENVKKVWASQYTARAIAFRKTKGIPLDGDPLGVAVIRMIDADVSGICFTVNPITGDRSKVIIETNWGLGEGVVSGGETIDTYIVEKSNLEIVEKTVRKKEKMVARKPDGGTCWVEVPPEKAERACLSDEQIKMVAAEALKVEEKMGMPQDIEWAIESESSELYLLQTRPAKGLGISASDKIAQRMSSFHRELKIKPDSLKSISFKF